MKNKKRILFVCKKRNNTYGHSFGLINSCKFICNALHRYDIDAEVVSVVDNNAIDREVHQYKPTHVFIEALWVVPPKFEVLLPRYPKVEWYVRVHSKIPFIANEGIAIEWLRECITLSKKYSNFHVSANNLNIVRAFKEAYNNDVMYFPNIYCPPRYPGHQHSKDSDKIIDIGCFGAIRPMKNQLIQAMAAIAFANMLGIKLRFHINADRIEQKGDPVLKNLENAFINTPHELVKHPWMHHEEFVKLVQKMDLGTQISMSETFNIVAADFVWNNVPVVGSKEIEWLSCFYKTEMSDIRNIIHRLFIAYHGKTINLQSMNKWKLDTYNEAATCQWLLML